LKKQLNGSSRHNLLAFSDRITEWWKLSVAKHMAMVAAAKEHSSQTTRKKVYDKARHII